MHFTTLYNVPKYNDVMKIKRLTQSIVQLWYTLFLLLILHIKSLLSNLSRIFYFSGGYAGQYKFKFNFYDVYYINDFDIDCECSLPHPMEKVRVVVWAE